MKISKGMIDNYLHYITHCHTFDGVYPDNLSEYSGRISKISQSLEWHNDSEPFKLALDYFLCHPEIDLENVSYPFTMEDDQLRDVIRYMKKLIWDEDGFDCEKVNSVELVNTTVDDWWKMRKQQGLHPEHPQS